jgi:hypothetical protein
VVTSRALASGPGTSSASGTASKPFAVVTAATAASYTSAPAYECASYTIDRANIRGPVKHWGSTDHLKITAIVDPGLEVKPA